MLSASTIHGFAKQGKARGREYISWHNAKARCFNRKNPRYADYGGRGITMCDRWKSSFAAFLEDMGKCPPGCTIERVDNDAPYEPGNCTWAPYSTQNANRRVGITVVYKGEAVNLTDLARRLDIKPKRLNYLYRRKRLPIDEAVRIALGVATDA